MAVTLRPQKKTSIFFFTTVLVECLFQGGSVCALSAATTTTATPPPLLYTSCASPRFDDFSEKLIGDWQWKDIGGDDDRNVVEGVKEVMRSCGGAVQGIREIPSLSSSTNDDGDGGEEDVGGYYLNRANDGFIYFDRDGSYSSGPVKASQDAGAISEPWISSLSFGKMRLLIRKDDNIKYSEDCKVLQVLRKFGGGEAIAITTEENTMLEELPQNIAWEEILRCRMSSPTQSWMMQRLKWEKCVLKEDGSGGGEKEGYHEDPAVTESWALDVTQEPAIIGILGDTSNSNVWSAGGICTSTGIVKSIIRQYSSTNGSLQSVVWLQGRTKQQKTNDAAQEEEEASS